MSKGNEVCFPNNNVTLIPHSKHQTHRSNTLPSTWTNKNGNSLLHGHVSQH